eukprot:GHVU01127525.1.p1 GENE.GHVU01127525.1~~GHVU01127525.1.p1  ORF type:complete len:113 (-),score=4.22 GHVU01127525.1:404-742(-)
MSKTSPEFALSFVAIPFLLSREAPPRVPARLSTLLDIEASPHSSSKSIIGTFMAPPRMLFSFSRPPLNAARGISTPPPWDALVGAKLEDRQATSSSLSTTTIGVAAALPSLS